MTVTTYTKPEPWNLSASFVTTPRLHAGLVSLVPFWDAQPFDYLRNSPLTATTSAGALPSMEMSRRGMVSVATTGSEKGYSFGTSSFVPLTNCTILIHLRKTDGTNRASAHFGPFKGAGTNERCGAHLPYSDGTIYWDFGGTAGGTSRLSVGGLTFGDDFWVFNAGPRGMEIWQNGFLRASQAGHATRSASAAPFYVLLGNSETPQASDNAECAMFAMWDYQLAQKDCENVGLDPWQLIRYDRAIRRAPTVAGGFGSLHWPRLVEGRLARSRLVA